MSWRFSLWPSYSGILGRSGCSTNPYVIHDVLLLLYHLARNAIVRRPDGASRLAGGTFVTLSGSAPDCPSGEIRPQQIDFNVSPNSAIANFMEPLPHALVPPPGGGSRDSGRPKGDRNQLQQQAPPSSSTSGGVPLNLNMQRQLHAISQQHRAPGGASSNDSFPSSPVYHPTSPMHHPVSPMHQSPNPFGQQSHHRHQSSQQYPPAQGHPSQPHSRVGSLGGPNAVPHSAPERVAFNIYTNGLPGGGQIPGLTLGPAGVPLNGMESGQSGHGSAHSYAVGRRASVSETSGSLHPPSRQTQHLQPHMYHGHMQMPILDQDISPLTSPWLGAHPTSSHPQDASSHHSSANSSSSGLRHAHRSSASMGNSNKRTASSSGDEGGSARKKQSPAIRPTIGMSIARLVGDKERERDSGSTSPLALNDRKSGKMRLGGERDREAEKRGSSWSSASASASGSVSPDPTRGAGEANEDISNVHHRNGSFAGEVAVPSNTNDNSSLEATTPTSNVNSNSFRPYRGSKSTNSTPLLRSTPSSALALGMSSMVSGGRNGGHAGRTRSKSRPGSVPMHASIPDVHDSPSPVDLNADRSMPPPPLPPGRQSDDSVNETRRAENGANVGMGGMMGMEGVESMNMGGLSDMNGSPMGMNFSGMMNNMGGMSDGMGSMNMGMNMGMGVNMDMDMSMGMEGMGMSNFSGNMGSLDMMNMGGMEFSHQQQQDNSHSHHDQQQQQQQQHADHHQQQDAHHDQQQRQQYQQQQQQQHHHQQPLVPVTPASIMNLGRLGISNSSGGSGRLGSASAHAASTGGAPAQTASGSGTTPAKKGGRKEGLTRGVATASGATRSTRTSTRNKSTAAIANTISPSLKPLLPAAHNTPNLDATLPSPMGSSQMSGGAIVASAGPVMQVRKTSHKAAEQKRRDSLKTTFDDLRKLLPPIALANDPDIDPNLITSPLFHATTPLLPGALPPRGPPKAGGDGPNKGVSKLQLLICGNEYIRLLTKRVERRDDEIEKLRREVKRLRIVAENKGEDAEDVEGRDGEQLDLERDLDAVERANMGIGISQANDAGEPNNNDAGAAEDAMDEADDDADD
ncbi:hypothetical protein D9619_008136 [Psilocybe cf. subviscida]|uniref:BHLH domain-containing protein n=1 Tax=Psilocybe cf. subviscida TaxID=2480587 RepID=A0A8H5ESF3_9AGAR|nr:hypothetical protein D9619_008136 [Psilocybe cf. subviscida]